MENEWLDAWIRGLAAAPTSRRGLLGGLVVLVGATPQPATARGDRGCRRATNIISDSACSAVGGCGPGTCGCAATVGGGRACISLIDFASPADCPIFDECNRGRHCGSREVCARVGACCGGALINKCIRRCGQ